MSPVLRVVLRILGFGALVAGGLAVALLAIIAAVFVGPLLFWIAWNVLNFASAVGLPELGFWGIVLATVFLVAGWFGKVVIAGIVFVIDPSWFHGAAASLIASDSAPSGAPGAAGRAPTALSTSTTRS